MKQSLCAIAAVAALAVWAGCGGASSSGDAPRDQSTGFAAAERTADGGAPKQTPDEPKPERKVKPGAEDTPVPLGTPLDARDARVRRAIADLLHPRKAGAEGSAPSDRGSKDEGDGDVGGLLDRLRRQIHERLEQLPGQSDGHPKHDDGLGVLEMLR
jgi:hypothetical protein